MKNLFIILLVLLATSCKTLQSTSKIIPPKTTAQPIFIADDKNTILSIILKIQTTPEETYEVVQINRSEGYLKAEKTEPDAGEKEDYVLELKDANKNTIKTLYHTNPFRQRYEYSEDQRTLKTVTLDNENPLLVIRTNYLPEIKNLRIKKRKNGVIVQETVLAIEVE